MFCFCRESAVGVSPAKQAKLLSLLSRHGEIQPVTVHGFASVIRAGRVFLPQSGLIIIRQLGWYRDLNCFSGRPMIVHGAVFFVLKKQPRNNQ